MLKSLIRKIENLFRSKSVIRPNTIDVIGTNSIILAVIEKREKGRIEIGNNCTVNGTLVVNTVQAFIKIGNNVSIGGSTIIESAIGIEIGSDVLISYQCIIQDSNNHSIKLSERKFDNLNWNRKKVHDWSLAASSKIFLDNGCWIGAKVIILKGVHLGEGCIVGAGSVVTKSFPAWSVIGGNPGKLIRTLEEHER